MPVELYSQIRTCHLSLVMFAFLSLLCNSIHYCTHFSPRFTLYQFHCRIFLQFVSLPLFCKLFVSPLFPFSGSPPYVSLHLKHRSSCLDLLLFPHNILSHHRTGAPYIFSTHANQLQKCKWSAQI